VLEMDRSPPDWITIGVLLGGGLACFAGAGFVFFVHGTEPTAEGPPGTADATGQTSHSA